MHLISRYPRPFLAGILLLALVLLAPATALAQDDELTDIGFAYFPAFHTMTAMIAAESGIFAENGLNVDMVRTSSGSLLIPTMLSGEVDFTTGNMTNVARLRAEGRDLVFIYPVVNRMTLNMVVSHDAMERLDVSADDPLEDKLAALCEMTIGYTSPNAPTDVFSRYYLREGGCDPSRAELVSIGGGGELIAALRAGRIDAFMLTPPSPNLVVLEGFGEIFIMPTSGEVPGLNDYPYTGIVVTKTYAEENRDIVVAMIRSLAQAGDLIRSDPERAIELLGAYFPDMEADVLRAGFEDMSPAVPEEGLIDESWVVNYFDLQYGLGMLEADIEAPTEEGVLWTNEYTREARASLEE